MIFEEYKYIVISYNSLMKISYIGHFIYKPDAIKALENHQKTLPYRENCALYEVKHYINSNGDK